MGANVDHTNLHRTAKYFMDSGAVSSHEEAMMLLHGFGLTVVVGHELVDSYDHQTALLTLINVARRTFLGGVEIVGLADATALTPLAPADSLIESVKALGGRVVEAARSEWPSALIGDGEAPQSALPCWRLVWEGWRGGVVPAKRSSIFETNKAIAIAPILAAAACAEEAFAFHAGDNPMAGYRPVGMSLWRPGADWLAADPSEPVLAFLPSKLWLIGLGNLGQAFVWVLACLPYSDRREIKLLLQDTDDIAVSNDSTSLLSFLDDVDHRKARVVAEWLEDRGFVTFIDERLFGEWTRRCSDEPAVALCGVDNALARAALGKPGFDLVVEAGLGSGPQSFRSFSVHTFPASRTAESIWSRQVGDGEENFEGMEAYRALLRDGMDTCGLAQLASRTVGVPFVGLIAALLVISELLRRLHGGSAFEIISGSADTLDHLENVEMVAEPYSGGHVDASPAPSPRYCH